jgi:ABC-type nitrate/sulfonate/bicarbonate transport system ATPase subunit
MEMTVLEARGITHRYETENIIEDISFQLQKKEIIGLLGVSGVGKTTLFQTLSGLIKPTEGSIVLKGEEITGQAGHVSYMLQKDMLLPYRTIEDNVALPLLIQGMKKKEAREKVGKEFAAFGLEGTQKKYPLQLSGGMRQRAALLRTYMFSNDVALLDEPFSALDAITKSEMHAWYLDIMQKIELSTIFITHDIDEAILLSDRIFIMAGRPGKIVEEIQVPGSKPRSEDFLLSGEFIELKRHILKLIKE